MAKPKGTATQNGGKPLLDLSGLDRVEFIYDVDGNRRDLVNLDALPIRPRNRIAELFGRCMELIARDAAAAQPASTEKPLTHKEQRELASGVRALVPLIVPSMTADILVRHKPHHLQEIVLAFFVVRSESAGRSTAMERMAAVVNNMMQSTGASSSRASSGSTAARTLPRGMRRSRRPS